MLMKPLKTVAIVGVGLIGGSFALMADSPAAICDRWSAPVA